MVEIDENHEIMLAFVPGLAGCATSSALTTCIWNVLQAKLAMDDLAVLVRHLTTLFELVLAYYALLG